MNVKDLIEELDNIENKDAEVKIYLFSDNIEIDSYLHAVNIGADKSIYLEFEESYSKTEHWDSSITYTRPTKVMYNGVEHIAYELG